MASSGVTFSAGQTNYIEYLNTLTTFSETWATEVETARDGEANLNARLVGMVEYVGLTANLPCANYRLTGLSDPIDSQDAATKSYVVAVASGGGSPGDISITSLGVGTATALQLIRINAAGTAPEGIAPPGFFDFNNWNAWGD